MKRRPPINAHLIAETARIQALAASQEELKRELESIGCKVDAAGKVITPDEPLPLVQTLAIFERALSLIIKIAKESQVEPLPLPDTSAALEANLRFAQAKYVATISTLKHIAVLAAPAQLATLVGSRLGDTSSDAPNPT